MRKLDEILKNERVWGHEIMFPLHSAWVKLPDCGKCSVIWSDCEDGMEHVSVSPKKQFRMPSWDDMCVLKDIFFEDEEEAYQIHPKNSQYVNDVENCLHLWKPKGHEIDELTKLEKQSRRIPVEEKLPDPDELVKIKTNADRIREMTDEELAEWLLNMCDFNGEDEEPYKSVYNLDTGNNEEIHDSYGDLLEWLMREKYRND